MELEFCINDYILMWELLFSESYSSKFNSFKTKLWKAYNDEYKIIIKDKEKIMEDPKNFIPDDDTIYNYLSNSLEYKKVYNTCENYKIDIMSVWDKYKKDINKNLKRILKIRLPRYKILIVYDKLNIVEANVINNQKYIILGKHYSNGLSIIYDILYVILKQEYQDKSDYFNYIITLVINELSTSIFKKALPYLSNSDVMTKLKIYPYFLMYLGVCKKDMENYMKKDSLFFDVNNYIYDNDLSRYTIYEFIEYVNKNINKILNSEEKDII